MAANLRTECAQTGRPLEMRVDSELGVQLHSLGASPCVCIPLVNFRKLGVDVIYEDL